MKAIEIGALKPSQSAAEKKNETTTRVAREIQDKEVTERERKTARLRAARLAQPPPVVEPPSRPARKRASAK